MLFRSSTKRSTKRRKGGWTPEQTKTVQRRQELLSYTSNSTRKSNAARQAVQHYLEAEREKNANATMITSDDVLQAITPHGRPAHLLAYVDYAERKCESLIETAIHVIMRRKKQINEERRLSKQATFLANRAAARAQQAAYIASIGRLSNSPIEPSVQAELNAWNKSELQRQLNQEENHKEAVRIFENHSTIQMEFIRLRYELTKQVVEQLEKLDYIIPLYQKIQTNSARLGAYYSIEKRNADHASIVPSARVKIVKLIPELNGTNYVDRALPNLMDEMMKKLVNASAAYVKTMKGTTLEVEIGRAHV